MRNLIMIFINVAPVMMRRVSSVCLVGGQP
jgi:hypothetical protein